MLIGIQETIIDPHTYTPKAEIQMMSVMLDMGKIKKIVNHNYPNFGSCFTDIL